MSFPSSVSDELRKRLVALADELIPAAEGMPAASTVDIAGKQLDRVVTARPDVVEPLVRGLTAAGEVDDAIAWMGKLASEDPEAHDAIAAAIVGGYYMHPEIMACLRYPGQTGREISIGVLPEYVTEGLLEHVVERGSIFRPAPR